MNRAQVGMRRGGAVSTAAVLVVALAYSSAVGRQEPATVDAHPVVTRNPAFESVDARISAGAATCLGAAVAPGGPITLAASLRAGDENGLCWSLVDPDQVRAFPAGWRDWIFDREVMDARTLEAEAYSGALSLAYWTSDQALEKAARDDLTYRQLFHQAKKYRGEIVRLTGRLKRVTKDDEPPEKARQAGVEAFYEGWLFNDSFGADPVCVVFPTLPPGLSVSRKMDQTVTFVGYYFKIYHYAAGGASAKPTEPQYRDAPLLIGRIVAVGPTGVKPAEDDWGTHLLPIFVVFLGLVMLFVVAMTVWFRRGDQHVHRRIAAAKDQTFTLPEADVERQTGPGRGNESWN